MVSVDEVTNLSVAQLRKRAQAAVAERRLTQAAVDAAEDHDEGVKFQLKRLVLEAAIGPERAAELRAMKVPTLRALAKEVEADEDKIKRSHEADYPKEDLAALIIEEELLLARQDEASPAQQPTATTSTVTVGTPSVPAAFLSTTAVDYQAMSMKELRKMAKDLGAAEDDIEAVSELQDGVIGADSTQSLALSLVPARPYSTAVVCLFLFLGASCSRA